MKLGPTPRIALITGANRGIGLESARQLTRRGFHVIIAARDERSGRQAAESISADKGTASYLPLDVSSSASIRAAAIQFATIADQLDVLVNNAGIYPDKGRTILALPQNRLEQTFETNTFGPLEVTQAFLPYMRNAKAARIINVSSG
jgi:NAD(P)-dependent dehydrogenase (short-subunit alcohol dehydrogenase family)